MDFVVDLRKNKKKEKAEKVKESANFPGQKGFGHGGDRKRGDVWGKGWSRATSAPCLKRTTTGAPPKTQSKQARLASLSLNLHADFSADKVLRTRKSKTHTQLVCILTENGKPFIITLDMLNESEKFKALSIDNRVFTCVHSSESTRWQTPKTQQQLAPPQQFSRAKVEAKDPFGSFFLVLECIVLHEAVLVPTGEM